MTVHIQSQRVHLRRFQLSDYENMRSLESEAEIVKFTPMRQPQTPEQTKAKLESLVGREAKLEPFGVWACQLKDSQEFVGWFMLQPTDLEYPELGFMLVKSFWGQGLASEIAGALIQYAFTELKVSGISARTDVSNTASMRVLEKLGFRSLRNILVQDKILNKQAELKVFALEMDQFIFLK